MLTKATFSALLSASAIGAPYDYSSNGANWGTETPLCDEGKEQSPINLFTAKTGSGGDMEINGYGYKDYTVKQSQVSRSAEKVQTDVADGEFHLNFADGSMSVFKPLQFHFHAPSEHTVDEAFYDLELHVVHLYADTAGLGAVIGFMFDRSAGNYDNDFLDAFLDDQSEDVTIKLSSFMNGVDFSEYWNYAGSLTTPPCTEGVKWTVIKQVQPISDAQLKKFTDLWAGNSSFNS